MRAVDVVKLKTPKSKECMRRLETSTKNLEAELKKLKTKVASLEKLLTTPTLNEVAK